MDKSEIKFKYRSGSTVVTIPSSIGLGEYYVNTGSGFMYLKSNNTTDNSLLFPGIIFSAVDDGAADDDLQPNDTYINATDKHYLLFEKYGVNSGRFVPGTISSICIAHADLAEIINNAIKVKVDSSYIVRVTSELAKGAPVFAVIGYTDDSYKLKNQFGSSSMVKLRDIDSNGYATVDYVVSGYLLMKNPPTSDDIINLGVTGMSWHIYDEDITLEDGTHMYGTVRLIRRSNEYALDIYTPYASVCNRSCVTVYENVQNGFRISIENDSTDRSVGCFISTTTQLSVKEALTFALSYLPMVYGKVATYRSGKKVFPAIASDATIAISIDKANLSNGIVNSLMHAGIHNIKTPSRTDSFVTLKVIKSNNTFLKESVPVLGGLELKVQPHKCSIPVWVIDTDDYENVPVSFIHGTIFGDEMTSDALSAYNLNNDWDISLNNNMLDELSGSTEFVHISSMYATHRETLLGGDNTWTPNSNARAAEPVFLIVDYQKMSLDLSGRSQSNTATIRKYIRLSSQQDTTISTPQGDITIDIS